MQPKGVTSLQKCRVGKEENMDKYNDNGITQNRISKRNSSEAIILPKEALPLVERFKELEPNYRVNCKGEGWINNKEAIIIFAKLKNMLGLTRTELGFKLADECSKESNNAN